LARSDRHLLMAGLVLLTPVAERERDRERERERGGEGKREAESAAAEFWLLELFEGNIRRGGQGVTQISEMNQ